MILRLRSTLDRSPIRRLGGVLQFILCIFGFDRVRLNGLLCAGKISAVSIIGVGTGIRGFRVNGHIISRLLVIPGFCGRRGTAVRVHHYIALLGAAGREQVIGDLVFAEAACDHSNQDCADHKTSGHGQPLLGILRHRLDSSFFC